MSKSRSPHSLTKRQLVIKCDDELSPFFSKAILGNSPEEQVQSQVSNKSPLKSIKIPSFTDILNSHNLQRKSETVVAAPLNNSNLPDEKDHTFGTPAQVIKDAIP